MATSNDRSQTVNASITLLELHGVKCRTERANVTAGGFKRLSAKAGGYTDVNDNSVVISSEPNVRAVVSFEHHASSRVDIKNVHEQHLPSLPMVEESRDAYNNIIMSGAWPDDDKRNSVHFSRNIQRVEIEDEENEGTEMSIPASISLRVGVIVDGSDEIQPLGVATVLISGKDQTLELSIPVEADKRSQKINPKAFFRHAKNSSMPGFHISGFTLLKIKLAVIAKPYDTTVHDVLSPAASFQDLGSKKLPPKTFGKVRARLCRFRDGTMHQVNSFRTKAVLVMNARKAKSSARGIDVADPGRRCLPELTVLPSSGLNYSQCQDGATEIVLNSSAVAAHDFDASKIATVFANSIDLESGIESSACSIATEWNQESSTKKTDSTSVSTQRTRSSSDKSSNEGFSEIVITASRVTFEESATPPLQPSPPQAASPPLEELFSKDVTTQLDEIVKDYSMRVNEDKVGSIGDAWSDHASTKEVEVTSVILSATISREESSNRSIEQPRENSPMLADVIVNSADADTPLQAAVEDLSILAEPQEMPKDGHIQCNSSRSVQSIMLTHEDETGTVYTVEVSMDGENVPRTTPSRTNVETKVYEEERNIDAIRPQIHRESSQYSHQNSQPPAVTPVQIFEGGIISVNHTVSSVGELTVDSSLEASTVPSVISKSLKVARNRRHPQRKEAANFLRRVTVCGRKYDIAELMDDAVVGWKDIVVGDDLCDGVDEFACEGIDNDSDDESATISLNTMDERVPSKSNFLGDILCREGKVARCTSQDESM
eukprot:CCRYP_012803-RA/>CCRYP_012803-RA protein AED:0.24 eAED:-0.39 QI:0/-1/0/1/-1/1/1/0/774